MAKKQFNSTQRFNTVYIQMAHLWLSPPVCLFVFQQINIMYFLALSQNRCSYVSMCFANEWFCCYNFFVFSLNIITISVSFYSGVCDRMWKMTFTNKHTHKMSSTKPSHWLISAVISGRGVAATGHNWTKSPKSWYFEAQLLQRNIVLL